MTLNSNKTINTREDLDATIGTPAYDEFMQRLAGSMTRKEDKATYPSDYSQIGHDGPPIEPVWADIEDLSTIERFGFTRDEIEAWQAMHEIANEPNTSV